MDLILTPIPGTDLPIIVVAGVIGLWLLLRTRATTIDSKAGLDEIVARGEPTVLEFFGKL